MKLLAARYSVSEEAVRGLAERFPMVRRVLKGRRDNNHRRGCFPLDDAAIRQRAPVERFRRRVFDGIPQALVVGRTGRGSPPRLHHLLAAVSYRAPVPAEVVRYLLKLWTKGLEKRNRAGSLPLHGAAERDAAPAEVGRALADGNPITAPSDADVLSRRGGT
jgi:hypothetical protein